MDVSGRGQEAELSALRESLREQLAANRALQFGAVKPSWVRYAEDYFWDETQQRWRLDVLARHGVVPGKQRILDLSSGCGQFVLLALASGYDCEGVEPDAWRTGFVERKIDLFGHPQQWKSRFHRAAAEGLPFESDSFDYVTSFQTLEHVANPRRAIAEMFRITRPGGAIHIMCPDYRSTFEAHYQLPWLPLFPRGMARLYLRLLGRPVEGLEGIQYVTGPRVRRWITDAQQPRYLLIADEQREMFEENLRRRGLAGIPGAYLLWRTLTALRYAGRRELSVSLLVRILEK